MGELSDTRQFYRDLLCQQHRTLSDLLDRHDRVHLRFQRLQLRHHALRYRLHPQHAEWLAEHDRHQHDQQQHDQQDEQQPDDPAPEID